MKETCIDFETLAAFAEGRLKRAEIAPLLAHLETCEVCNRALETAMDVHGTEQPGAVAKRPPWWLAVAAIVVLGVLAVPLLRRRGGNDDGIGRLVTLASQHARLVEPRLSGGFAWAQYRGPVRANDDGRSTERLKIDGAAGEIIERADREHGPAAEHAAGMALVLIDQPLQGVARLEKLVADDPGDATAWNDLAAARYAAAAHLGRPSLYPEALAAADKAVGLAPRMTEALFNRALILEKLGLREQAAAAWQRYLEADPSSPWATEARARLARLGPLAEGSVFRRELPRLERAAASGDAAAVREVVARFPEECRRLGETEHLGLWAEAVQRGDAAEAARLLTVARATGAALVAVNGESLLRDAVQAIETADAPHRATLADAHATYRQGRLVYSRHLPSEAEPKLRRAAMLFAEGGSPMALVARSFAANTRFDQNDVGGARGELQALRAASEGGAYTALGAQVQWELALCATVDADWSGALAPLRSAEAGFRKLGERNLQGFMTTMQAQTYAALGRPEEAWAAWIRSFELMSGRLHGDRIAVALSHAVISEVRAGRREPALALLHLASAAARDAGDPAMLSNVLVWQAVLEAELGDEAGARATLASIEGTASRISDGKLRERAEADRLFAGGAVLLRSDANAAASLLTQAEQSYTAVAMPLLLPETFLLRARARMRLGDAPSAARDLEGGIAAMERQLTDDTAPAAGAGIIDAADALFEEAINLSLSRGDAASAFGYAERQRGPGVRQVSGAEAVRRLQDELRGSGAVVLELVTTRREAIAFVVTEKDFTVTRTPFARDAMAGLSRRALYDALVRPSAPAIAGARMLIVVPDAALQAVPFAALDNGSGPLVEKLPVAIASSAASLHAEDEGPRGTTLAVALPTGEAAGNAALPETAQELDDVASLYAGARSLRGVEATFAAFLRASREARVIHLAGHTQSGGGETALVFAPDERVSWKGIASSALGRPSVVVLAACETLVRPSVRQSRALSIGQAFAAAGAREVVGTLAPIADAESRAIFRVFHRELSSGTPAPVALQRAQLDALAHHNDAWAQVELLTTRIPR
jgi:tetratricopeptide (TPR) repeat protein